jgi:hypothetical protein
MASHTAFQGAQMALTPWGISNTQQSNR